MEESNAIRVDTEQNETDQGRSVKLTKQIVEDDDQPLFKITSELLRVQVYNKRIKNCKSCARLFDQLCTSMSRSVYAYVRTLEDSSVGKLHFQFKNEY